MTESPTHRSDWLSRLLGATMRGPLLRMYDPATLRLEANVRESAASKLAQGRPLTAEIDALKKKYSVVVDEIVPSADPGSRSFLFKVNLPDAAGLCRACSGD